MIVCEIVDSASHAGLRMVLVCGSCGLGGDSYEQLNLQVVEQGVDRCEVVAQQVVPRQPYRLQPCGSYRFDLVFQQDLMRPLLPIGQEVQYRSIPMRASATTAPSSLRWIQDDQDNFEQKGRPRLHIPQPGLCCCLLEHVNVTSGNMKGRVPPSHSPRRRIFPTLSHLTSKLGSKRSGTDSYI